MGSGNGPTRDFKSSSIRDRINIVQMFFLGLAGLFAVAGIVIISTNKTDNRDAASISFYVITGITVINVLLVLTLWVLDTDKIQVLLSGILLIHDFLVLTAFILQVSIAFAYEFDSNGYKDYLLFSGFLMILLSFSLIIFDILYIWKYLKRAPPSPLVDPDFVYSSNIVVGQRATPPATMKDECVTNNFYYGPAPVRKCGSDLGDITSPISTSPNPF